jgi:hypothetical protein
MTAGGGENKKKRYLLTENVRIYSEGERSLMVSLLAALCLKHIVLITDDIWMASSGMTFIPKFTKKNVPRHKIATG